MNVVQAVEELLDYPLNFAKGEFDIDIGQKTSQVMITEIKYEVERAAIIIVGYWTRAAYLN